MPPNVDKGALFVSSTSGNIPASSYVASQENDDAMAEVQTGGGDRVDFDRSEQWVPPASEKSLRTINPIRAIVDPIVANSVKCGKKRGDGKDQISLALGDPTAFGNLEPSPAIVEAVISALKTPTLTAGYINACGTDEARSAIASHHSEATNGADITADDVIVANGCSGALEIALTSLLDEDSVLLVPRPGFPLYQVIAESHGARVVHYDLMPEQQWECNLRQLEQIIEEENSIQTGSSSQKETSKKQKVRGIVINNPSNPTGSVYSKDHLFQIIDLAIKYRIPIVADEVYGDLTFNGNIFHPLIKVAADTGKTLPIITTSGLGKQYLVPGWRVGWIVFYDGKSGALREVIAGAKRLAQVVLGASHLAQCAIPAALILSTESDFLSIARWKGCLKSTLERQAAMTVVKLRNCHGLSVIAPQGTMYAMIRILTEEFDDCINDDISFTKMLLEEENVFALPGRAFGASRDEYFFFRVVFCAPEDTLLEAFKRIAGFCLRHASS